MKIFLIITLYLLIEGMALSQKIEPFGEQKFGIRNKFTGKVLIHPKYAKIVDYNDSLIIVQSESLRFAVLDTLDNIVIPFSSDVLAFEKYNKKHLGQIIEKSTSVNYPNSYYVDKHRNCIPYDYCSCPKGKALTDSVPLYLRFIHKGNVFFDEHQRDSAFYYFDKAIDANPNNIYVYFNRVCSGMINDKGQYITNKESLGQKEFIAIVTNLDMASTLSKTPEDHLIILNLKRRFYSYYLKDKALLDSIDRESKKYNPEIINDGLFLNAGMSYANGLEMELGLSLGILSNNEKYWHKPYVSNGFVFLGCSYLKNISQKLDGYKIYFISFVKPLNISLCPIFYTDYKRTDWILRPEIGMGFKHFAFNVGYNCFVNRETYKELNSVSLNIRYYLPLITNKNYTVR